jgi:hypothetical protein
MRVTEVRSTPSGIQMCTYHPAGPLKTGSMNDEAPTEKELARQRKHAEEDTIG